MARRSITTSVPRNPASRRILGAAEGDESAAACVTSKLGPPQVSANVPPPACATTSPKKSTPSFAVATNPLRCQLVEMASGPRTARFDRNSKGKRCVLSTADRSWSRSRKEVARPRRGRWCGRKGGRLRGSSTGRPEVTTPRPNATFFRSAVDKLLQYHPTCWASAGAHRARRERRRARPPASRNARRRDRPGRSAPPIGRLITFSGRRMPLPGRRKTPPGRPLPSSELLRRKRIGERQKVHSAAVVGGVGKRRAAVGVRDDELLRRRVADEKERIGLPELEAVRRARGRLAPRGHR